MALSSAKFIFDCMGIEASSSPVINASPVVVLGTAYAVNPTGTLYAHPPLLINANVDIFNVTFKAVINERNESNVFFLDLNTVFNFTASVDPTYYTSDGLHQNDKGHAAIADAVIILTAKTFSSRKLTSQ